MSTYGNKLIELSSLTGTHSASDHFMSITTGTGDGAMSGSIGLDNNKFQEIAIPVQGRKVKEYFLDAILATVQTQTPSAQLTDIVEFAKSFPANDATSGVSLAFVPGVTNPAASGNFYLVSDDGASKEINGFLLKMKDYSAYYTGEIVFNWTTEDNI